MLKSKPPARSTARRGLRLRFPFVAVAAVLLVAFVAAGSSPGSARSSGLDVLVAAPVGDQARETMPQALWLKFVAAYVPAKIVPFDGSATPTLDDCRKAKADFLLDAPFDVRPRLPGMPNSSGRVAAHTHLVVTNCITGTTIIDQNVNFDSDPPTNNDENDFRSVPEIMWTRAVPAMLKKFPLHLERVARITNLNSPFAFVDLGFDSHVSVGDTLHDFATPDHANRAVPILLTVTQVFPNFVQVAFSALSGDVPSVGDLVEPIPKAAMPAPAALKR